MCNDGPGSIHEINIVGFNLISLSLLTNCWRGCLQVYKFSKLNDEFEEENYSTLGRDLGIFIIKKKIASSPCENKQILYAVANGQ